LLWQKRSDPLPHLVAYCRQIEQTAELKQQLASTTAELRRLRSAAGLVDSSPLPGAGAAAASPTPGDPATPGDAARVTPGGGSDPEPATADLAAALGRAVRAEVALSDAESSLVQLRYKVSLLEHGLKAKEGEEERMRERLADKVAKEERRLARDKAAYARWVVSVDS